VSSRLSRRRLATYVADGLLAGTPTRAILFEQLAGYLIDTRRTKELGLIVRDIEYRLADKGHLNATVTSAFDLTSETMAAITTFVKQKTKAHTVMLNALVDPSVLGGIKISLPGHEINQTIAHQLTVLKTRFKKV